MSMSTTGSKLDIIMSTSTTKVHTRMRMRMSR